MVAFLSKSDASDCFDQIVDFLNGQVIQYALMVNPTIYVSCIKQFRTMVSIKKANDVVKLRALIDEKRVVVTEDVIRQDLRLDDADGVECLPNEEIFTELARRKFNFSKYIFDSMVRNVNSPIKFLMYLRFLQVIINAQVDDLSFHTNQYTSLALTQKEEDKVEVPATPTPPSPSNEPSPPPQEPITTPPQAQPAPPPSPPQEKPTTTSESSMTLLNNLRETWEKIAEIDADEDVTLVDAKTQVDLGAELQGRKDDDNAATKDVSAAEPTVFDDEEVTMTMAHTLIKMKAKKQDSLMSRWLKGCMMRKKYQSIKWKPISIAQARKNMIIYLKNMAGYRMEHFKVPTVDKEKALWVELKRLFEPDANDVIWKLQRYMHHPLLWKLHSNCGVHQVSSTTRRHDMCMLTEQDYLLSNGVMTLMLSTKLQVEEDSEMARDLVMKIFMKANKPKSRSFDTSSK
uniref:Xylulose kinase-1 n=1 Tax=Tanacetum cinerariifolium TaxID=118510 RepID=A0A6L2N3E1_TANCI|nr:hypothetical protein [Tanacetum cinerariifolium]